MALEAVTFPRLMTIRQRFPRTEALDLQATVAREFAPARSRIKPGARVAVAVGSRGIRNLKEIVQQVLGELQSAGATPFIVPAMGSHGGATPEGQSQLLADYGITESFLRVPVDASMEVDQVGSTDDGVPAFVARSALQADGIVLVNRIKPHTDFRGNLGSGLLKMLAVGLGKRPGASTFHRASNRFGYEQVIRSISQIVLESAPILCGVAVVENHFHETARLQVLSPDQFERGEETLFQEASRLLPKLPFDSADLLIVDRLGKNISGTGMDPNVIGRSIHGYSSHLKERDKDTPAIRRLFVRELTPESHGNATGIGMADFTTTRFVQAMNPKITFINGVTAMTPQGSKVPIHFDTDRELLTYALDTLGVAPGTPPKVLRITDTQELEILAASTAYEEIIRSRSDLELLQEARDMAFDDTGNLLPIRRDAP